MAMTMHRIMRHAGPEDESNMPKRKEEGGNATQDPQAVFSGRWLGRKIGVPTAKRRPLQSHPVRRSPSFRIAKIFAGRSLPHFADFFLFASAGARPRCRVGRQSPEASPTADQQRARVSESDPAAKNQTSLASVE